MLASQSRIRLTVKMCRSVQELRTVTSYRLLPEHCVSTLGVECAPKTGGEFQWGRRENRSDGWVNDDYQIQFGLKYSSSFDVFGGTKQ